MDWISRYKAASVPELSNSGRSLFSKSSFNLTKNFGFILLTNYTEFKTPKGNINNLISCLEKGVHLTHHA